MIGALMVKKMMHKGYELLSQGNLSEFLKDLADDSVFVYPGNAKVSGTFKGKAVAVRDYFRFTEYLKEGWGEL